LADLLADTMAGIIEVSPKSVIAVILAAGSGSRLGGETPKQLLDIAGRTVLEHSAAAFVGMSQIDDVVVVTRDDMVDEVKTMLSGPSWEKVSAVVAGGDTRTGSTRAGLAVIAADEKSKVLIHDAVRPLVDSATIERCIEALDSFDAVSAAIPSSDTIVEVEKDVIQSIPPRSSLRRLQTPQGFRLGTLLRAYREAERSEDTATDDCGIVARHLPAVKIAVVEGSVNNLKITHPDDVVLAERLLAERKR
jgi:2-C-methyl-D-erythritol 4-phosphate cytidylyltransferase